MILSSRPQPSPSRTHISYPMNSELAPSFSSPELVSSPPTLPQRSNKHSFTKPMTWLNRSSSSTSTTALHVAPKPTRISEPRTGSSLDQLGFHRSGPLGSGATIVRTPQEALSGSTHRSTRTSEEDGVKRDVSLHDSEKNESRPTTQRPPSPPLPPLPDVPDTEGDILSGRRPSVSLAEDTPPLCSSGSPSPPTIPAHFSSSRPTLVGYSSTPSRSTPALPVDTSSIPPQPPFEAILLSPIPDGAIDPSKLIVTLETSTTSYRVLLRSLVSRPSHLSHYITSLLPPVSETASIHSDASEASASLGQHDCTFNSFFRDHLVSSGCLPRSTSIHIFLDRPSAPYTHVLAYLRSSASTPEYPETLPRAVQLGSTPSSLARLESLLDLRDEARYLGLVELETLCCHELHRFQRVSLASSTGGTPRGPTPSVHSVHTVVEECLRREASIRSSELKASKGNNGSCRTAKSAGRECSSGSSLESHLKDALVRGRQGRGVKYDVGSPPPGWI